MVRKGPFSGQSLGVRPLIQIILPYSTSISNQPILTPLYNEEFPFTRPMTVCRTLLQWRKESRRRSFQVSWNFRLE